MAQLLINTGLGGKMKKKRSIVFCVLIAACLTFCLSGCGDQQDASSNGSTTKNEASSSSTDSSSSSSSSKKSSSSNSGSTSSSSKSSSSSSGKTREQQLYDNYLNDKEKKMYDEMYGNPHKYKGNPYTRK